MLSDFIITAITHDMYDYGCLSSLLSVMRTKGNLFQAVFLFLDLKLIVSFALLFRKERVFIFGVWRSWLAHLHGVQGVESSSLFTPTKRDLPPEKFKALKSKDLRAFLFTIPFFFFFF